MTNGPTAGQGMDVTFYSLHLNVTGPRGSLTGSVTTDAEIVGSPASSLTVDLSPGIVVDSVRLAGSPVTSTRSGGVLTITLPRSYAVGERVSWTVYYHGTPASTGFGSYTDSVRANGTRWIYTLSEPYGAREWWPCVDHPTDKADSVEVRITVPTGYRSAVNGVLRDSVQNGDGSTTVRWMHRYPIASYLVAINVSSYDVFDDWYRYAPTDSMRIVNYVQPDLFVRRPTARAAAGLTPKMFEVFEGMFGPYPFRPEGYGHVEFGWGGGMEHQTLTSLGWAAFNAGTIAHELAHQWFGDLITCRTWPDLWLNEGFATYADALFRERYYGRPTFIQTMLSKVSSARSAVGTLYVQDTASTSNLFASSRVYNKGAWVLHMLRGVLGDSLFFAGLRAYADDPSKRFRTSSTAELRTVFESVSGRDLGFFFDQWVFGERYPAYQYSMTAVPQGSSILATVRIRQTTGTSLPPVFQMPVDLRFVGSSLDTMVTVWNDSSDQSWQFLLAGLPDSVTLDPDSWILKTSQRMAPSFVGDGTIPNEVELAANYPNPFNGTTMIRIGLPDRGHALLEVFDVTGKRIDVLVNGVMNPGRAEFPWSTSGASGVYLCRLQVTTAFGTSVSARRMLYLK